MSWVLVFTIAWPYAGGPATVPGFTSEKACEAAGAKIDEAFDSTLKYVRWTCVRVE